MPSAVATKPSLEACESILDSLLTEEELCKKFNFTRQGVFLLRFRDGLPHIKIGRSVRYHGPSVDRWLQARETSRPVREPAPKKSARKGGKA